MRGISTQRNFLGRNRSRNIPSRSQSRGVTSVGSSVTSLGLLSERDWRLHRYRVGRGRDPVIVRSTTVFSTHQTHCYCTSFFGLQDPYYGHQTRDINDINFRLGRDVVFIQSVVEPCQTYSHLWFVIFFFSVLPFVAKYYQVVLQLTLRRINTDI